MLFHRGLKTNNHSQLSWIIWSKLTPIHYTWEGHKNTFPEKFWVFFFEETRVARFLSYFLWDTSTQNSLFLDHVPTNITGYKPDLIYWQLLSCFSSNHKYQLIITNIFDHMPRWVQKMRILGTWPGQFFSDPLDDLQLFYSFIVSIKFWLVDCLVIAVHEKCASWGKAPGAWELHQEENTFCPSAQAPPPTTVAQFPNIPCC